MKYINLQIQETENFKQDKLKKSCPDTSGGKNNTSHTGEH